MLSIASGNGAEGVPLPPSEGRSPMVERLATSACRDGRPIALHRTTGYLNHLEYPAAQRKPSAGGVVQKSGGTPSTPAGLARTTNRPETRSPMSQGGPDTTQHGPGRTPSRLSPASRTRLRATANRTNGSVTAP